MTDVQASVLAVEVQPKPTKKGNTWWKAKLSNGVELPVWELADATKLSQIPKGNLVTFDYDATQNGQYTNYSLKSFSYNGPTAAAAITEAPKGSNGGSGGMSAEDKERVTFLSLFSSVSTIFSGAGSVDDAWAAAVGLQKRLFPKAVSVGTVETPAVESVPAPAAESGIPWS